MRNILTNTLIILILQGCAAVGTSTLYKSTENTKVQRIGYIDLYKASDLLKIYPQTTQIFRESVPASFKRYGINDVKFIRNGFSKLVNYQDPDTSLIQILCMENQLEALLLTKIHFINTHYYLYVISTGVSMDTEVEMKLYSKSGQLIVSTLHNTKTGNDYIKSQPANVTIRDGTFGAIKNMAYELGYRREYK